MFSKGLYKAFLYDILFVLIELTGKVMNKIKASDFARNPEKVYEQAKAKPVQVDRHRTNGEVKDSFVISNKEHFEKSFEEIFGVK